MRPSAILLGYILVTIWLAAQVCLATEDRGGLEQGQTYYIRYCASCHGPNGDGKGPVANVLSTKPADLRLLGERYGMPLRAERLREFIDGRSFIAAHGTRDMPVWGERFNEVPVEGPAREKMIKDRIEKMLAYLQSIQIQRPNRSSKTWP